MVYMTSIICNKLETRTFNKVKEFSEEEVKSIKESKYKVTVFKGAVEIQSFVCTDQESFDELINEIALTTKDNPDITIEVSPNIQSMTERQIEQEERYDDERNTEDA